jgi:hypothetical protein
MWEEIDGYDQQIVEDINKQLGQTSDVIGNRLILHVV